MTLVFLIFYMMGNLRRPLSKRHNIQEYLEEGT
jgi:hypothetical protein